MRVGICDDNATSVFLCFLEVAALLIQVQRQYSIVNKGAAVLDGHEAGRFRGLSEIGLHITWVVVWMVTV